MEKRKSRCSKQSNKQVQNQTKRSEMTIHMQVVHKVSPREERIITEEDDIRVIKEKALAAID